MRFPYLRHPLILTALFLTAINDHFLKPTFHNYLTGKISDFSGLFFFPVFLYAIYDLRKKPSGRHEKINLKKLVWCVLVTDVLFVVIKFTGVRLWLMSVLPLQITPDPSDVLAITVNIATVAYAYRFRDEDSFI